MAYDSTYSAYASIAGGSGYDSTYSAMKAAAVALGAEDKNYDSEYSIAVELATLAENGEIGGGGSGEESYSYKKPSADDAGLKEIGWDDISIKYYKDNNLQYEWRKNNFKVSEENKALYGVIDANTKMSSVANLKYCPMFDTSNVTNMNIFNNGMFEGCTSLTSIPLLDTSNVTHMGRVFNRCGLLTSIPLLDTSNVTSMQYMFGYCTSLTSIPLLDTSNVANMDYMFYNCYSLTSIPQFDTSKVKQMYYMLNSCRSLTSIPLLDCSSVTDANSPIGSTNLDNLTDIGGFKDLKVSWSSNFLDKVPNATVESLMNVINYAYDLTANGLSGKTLKFGTTNLAKLTEDEIAIATAKGWTLT